MKSAVDVAVAGLRAASATASSSEYFFDRPAFDHLCSRSTLAVEESGIGCVCHEVIRPLGDVREVSSGIPSTCLSESGEVRTPSVPDAAFLPLWLCTLLPLDRTGSDLLGDTRLRRYRRFRFRRVPAPAHLRSSSLLIVQVDNIFTAWLENGHRYPFDLVLVAVLLKSSQSVQHHLIPCPFPPRTLIHLNNDMEFAGRNRP